MKLVFFAGCPSAIAYLEAAIAAGAAPALVVSGARAVEPMRATCESERIPFARCTDVNAPGFVERIEKLRADLLVVAGCGQILKPRLLGAFHVGAVNFHPSLLPRYRGREPLFWMIARGEETCGVTAHWMTLEVDGGPVLAQREVAIPPRATSATLAEQTDREGAALLRDLIDVIRRGDVPRGRPQGDGTHVPPLRPEHGLIDFAFDARVVDRLVRACYGALDAYTFAKGVRVIVVEGEPLDGTSTAPPGTLLDAAEEGLDVATAAGVYRARRFVFAGRSYDARRLASDLGLGVGDRFAANPALAI